jgi:hypothetical protein
MFPSPHHITDHRAFARFQLPPPINDSGCRTVLAYHQAIDAIVMLSQLMILYCHHPIDEKAPLTIVLASHHSIDENLASVWLTMLLFTVQNITDPSTCNDTVGLSRSIPTFQ